MPILNYTTTVTVDKSIAEIQKQLVKAKARQILTEFGDDGSITAISFQILHLNGPIYFRLPAKVEAIEKILKRQRVQPRFNNKAHAARVAWRIVKDWLEAQLAMVEAEQADIVEIFLPYAQGSDGRTVYQALSADGMKALTHQPGQN